MFNLPAGLLLDGVLAVLLVATIVYCYILNRRLGNIRAAGDQMTDLVGKFSTATEQAKAGIVALKLAAEEDGQRLQETLDMARVMRDELAFLTETGDSLATRLANAREGAKPVAMKPVSVGPVSAGPVSAGYGAGGPSIPMAPGSEGDEIRAALEMARAAAEGGEGPDSEAERQLLQALRQVR